MSSAIITLPKSTPFWFEPALWLTSVISMIGVTLMYAREGMGALVSVSLGCGLFIILTILGKIRYGFNIQARTAMLINMTVISALHYTGALWIGTAASIHSAYTALVVYGVAIVANMISSIVILVKCKDAFTPSGFGSRTVFLVVAIIAIFIHSVLGSMLGLIIHTSMIATIVSLIMSSGAFWIPRILANPPEVEIKEEPVSA